MSFITLIDGILDMNDISYLREARQYAKAHGYNPELLTFSTKKLKKLNYDGIDFGGALNNDYISYKFFEKSGIIPKGEAKKHRNAYLKRSSQIHGDWKHNPLSKNNLARRILWNE